MKMNRIIYSITVEDVVKIVQQTMGRNPTEEEIKYVEENLGEKIAWFELIEILLREYRRGSPNGLRLVK